MVFYDGSNHEYCFIIKELAKKFEGEFNCLWENSEKHKTFPVPTTKEIKRISKYGKETAKKKKKKKKRIL